MTEYRIKGRSPTLRQPTIESPALPRCRKRLTSNQDFTDGSLDQINFDAVVIDTDGFDDGANGIKIPAGLAGDYQIDVHIELGGSGTWPLTDLFVAILVNGSEKVDERLTIPPQVAGTISRAFGVGIGPYTLAVDDVVTARASQRNDVAVTRRITADATFNYLSVIRLG